MPYTVNSIGTHYYGRGNKSEVVGRCEQCGRTARLTSYDTWEFICVLFVPLIPLQRYRILSDCTSCRRHHRLPLAQFRGMIDQKVAPLRQRVASAPHDAEARHGLVGALMGLEMWTEADREARAGVTALPSDSELNRLAGEIARYRGDRNAATSYLRKAVDLSSKDVSLRTLLGQHLLETGDVDDAIRELAQAQAADNSHWQAPYWLAQATLRANRFGEALAALERVLALRPDFRNDEAILADIVRCKRALGYPLSPEEEKATRRRWWWPFGRGRGAARRATGIPWWGIPAVLAAAVAVVLGIAAWRQRHAEIYFDNGLSTPVTIALGSQSFRVPPQGLVRRSVAPGQLEVVVTGAQGPIERTPIRVESLGLFSALFSSGFHVYNVSERHIYRLRPVVYTADSPAASAQGPESQLIAFERFFFRRSADYVFTTPPQTISLSSGRRAETRTAFDVARDVDYYALTGIRFQEGKTAEAVRAARKTVEIEGCALRARRNLVLVLLYGGKTDDALAEVQRWRNDCRAGGIELERVYQDAMRIAGKRDQLLAEYRERLVRTPRDAATHYLLGRLSDDPRRGLAEQRQAVQLDPQLTWAHVAMAHDLMSLEQPDEAVSALSLALALPHDSEIPVTYAHAAVASGRLVEAKQRLDELSKRATQDPALAQARWLIAMAQRDWPTAARLDRQLFSLTEDEAESSWRAVASASLQDNVTEAARRLNLAAGRPALALSAASMRFAHLVETERYTQAVAALDAPHARAKSPVPGILRLHAASALLLAGDKAAAAKRLQDLDASLADAPDDSETAFLRAGAGVLRGALPPAQLIEAARRRGYLSLDEAYYWAGVSAQVQGRRDAARQYFHSSVHANCDFTFPYLAAKRLAGAARNASAARE